MLKLRFLFLSLVSSVVENAAVRDDSKPADAKSIQHFLATYNFVYNSASSVCGYDLVTSDPLGAARHVFMPESDASNFFKRRSRRSVRYAEMQGTLPNTWLTHSKTT